ncbi:hypothetical protein BFJ63_vAg18627 [Fusarium oxysporum f. sp. narcissi]|uniref:Uncharacterized protein n=1 Tax=Fusarium oxysporum f. sp. narcissi TaxID=451672 RepID=A0A4Q2V170_FUSOX|nr:hypothetical protein BFJ63_vAg18627 [Fusarium oxysporum f. sp. narcissi]
MMARMLVLCSLLLLAELSSCSKPESCGRAIVDSFSSLTFAGIEFSEDQYLSMCQNELRVISIYSSMRRFCDRKEINAGLAYFNGQCGPNTGEAVASWNIISNISTAQTRKWPKLQYSDLNSGKNYTSPVLLSDRLFKNALKSVVCSS